jgi:O-antigen ligase
MPGQPKRHGFPLSIRSPFLGHATARLDDFIARRWVALGLLTLLTGMFWVANGSLYTKLFYALIAAPALIGLVIRPRRLGMLLREPIILAFILFSSWLLATLAWTQSDTSAGSLVKRPIYVFMMFAAVAMLAIKDKPLLLHLLRIAGALAAIAALVSLALFYARPAEDGRLIGSGALRNPLLTSHVLGFFCTYWLVIWLTGDRLRRWLPLLALSPLLAALLATGSRTPLLALALTSLWLLVVLGRRALYVLAPLALGGLIIGLLYPEILLQRGTSFRPELWREALRQAEQHLWLGHGYNSPFTFSVEGLRPLRDPHNVELAVLLESGLVGLALWLAMYGLTFIRCVELRHGKDFQLACALVVYGLSAGLTEGSNFLSRPNENWFLIWIPLALTAALSIQRRQGMT